MQKLVNIHIDNKDQEIYNNKNNNLHSEINLCYNGNVINDFEGSLK